MNHTYVSEKTSPSDLTSKTEITPFVKVHSIGDSFLSTFHSPIVKGRKVVTKKKPPSKVEPPKRKSRVPWTKAEDDRLMALIQPDPNIPVVNSKKRDNIVYGKVATLLNTGRTAKQCRDRWHNFLRGGIKKGGWTVDEEDLIKDLYATFGAKWSVMAKLFKDRTDNDIKNKWYSMKRKDERNGTSKCKNPFADSPAASDSQGAFDYSASDRCGNTVTITTNSALQRSSSDRNGEGPPIATTSNVDSIIYEKLAAV